MCGEACGHEQPLALARTSALRGSHTRADCRNSSAAARSVSEATTFMMAGGVVEIALKKGFGVWSLGGDLCGREDGS